MSPPVASTTNRVADVLLRGHARPVRARVHWPNPTHPAPVPALLVLFTASWPDGGEAAHLAGLLGVVTLSASPATVAEALATMEWAADHAADLGADPRRLVIAGTGAAANLAAAVSVQARDNGWPSIARQVLIQPCRDGLPGRARPSAGVAPATVITFGEQHLPGWLRDVSDEVDHVHSTQADAALGHLARSLQHMLDAPQGPSTTRRPRIR